MPAHIGSTYPVPTHIVSVGVALALRRYRLLMSIKYVLTTHVDVELLGPWRLEVAEEKWQSFQRRVGRWC